MYVNDRGDPQMELRHRLSVCMGVWKKLGLFFKSSDCSVRLKLQVFNAILRSKLMYGLESAQLTESSRQRLDTFQLKGLRQILKITTTYVDRQHSNAYVYARANEQLRLRNTTTNPVVECARLQRKSSWTLKSNVSIASIFIANI